jgi:arylsulfatase A-like enzyme
LYRQRQSGASSFPLLVVLLAAVVGLTGCLVGVGVRWTAPQQRANPAQSAAVPKKPNIIFVLTDDLSWDLVPYMANVKAMRDSGTTFTDFFVSDSLCCTSRATIFTGRFPHNTGVRTNFPPDGGYEVFKARGGEQASYAPALRGAGYRTALMGKYLNGYQPAQPNGGSGPYVPPGWDEWHVAGNGYNEYGYNLNENGRIVHYGNRPQDYLTDVLANKSVEFVQKAAADRSPFFLQVATFAPHGPFVAAPRHTNAFPNARAPRPPSFNEADNTDKPSWLRSRPRLGPPAIGAIDGGFRDRVRMVQSVDEMIGRLQKTLDETGLDRETYVVFGSDNGFHLGQYRLRGGKMTAYDSDVKVPFIVTGPGVPRGRDQRALAQNTDIAPTFLELAGAPVPQATDGRSLVPFLRGRTPAGWRDVALIEHVKPPPSPVDPDRQDSAPGAPPTYNAIRTANELYVEYENGEREYYQLTHDPHALVNAAQHSPDRLQALSSLVYALTQCSGPSCATAGRTR